MKTHLAQLQEREEQMWSRLEEAMVQTSTPVAPALGVDSGASVEPPSISSSEALRWRPVRFKVLIGYALLGVLVTIGLWQLARRWGFRSTSRTQVAMNEGKARAAAGTTRPRVTRPGVHAMNEGKARAAAGTVKGCLGADWLMNVLPSQSLPIAGNCPPSRYQDAGACPYEGCVYGEWIATKDTDVYADWQTYSRSTPALFQVRNGEKVLAVTGVVVTEKPGVVLLKRARRLGNMMAQQGEIFYVLTPRGEGFCKIMFRNEVVDNVDLNDHGGEFFQALSFPELTWWVQIRNAQGQIGWVKDADNFKNKDRFE